MVRDAVLDVGEVLGAGGPVAFAVRVFAGEDADCEVREGVIVVREGGSEDEEVGEEDEDD